MRYIRSKRFTRQDFDTYYLYKFILRKNTKYEIGDIVIYMNIEEADSYFHSKFTFQSLIITFPEYSRKCTFKRLRTDVAVGNIFTDTVYDDLTPYGGSCIDEVDPALALKLIEMEKDKTEQTDGDKLDQTDDHKSDHTDGDISDQINEKKGFWTTRSVLAIVLPIVAVIICVVILAIILRDHKSKQSIKA
ncbi:hypothetical protein RF11_15278 [Thelohanellus kitauei]|uniref:Uncharacterized protein n=1 Tax=Thelohanellus kitauei TaxID=669202 RepID=A0A0C2MX77_THEKT|nr:hypothetical protein RF11_15278 [Thelohanellus kitauei]